MKKMIVMFSVMLGTMLPAIANSYPSQQVLNAFKNEFNAAIKKQKIPYPGVFQRKHQ